MAYPQACPCVSSLRDCELLVRFCKVVGSVPKKACDDGLRLDILRCELSSIAMLTPTKITVSDLVSAARQILQGRVCHGLDLDAGDWTSGERGWRTHPACGIRNGAAWSGDAYAK